MKKFALIVAGGSGSRMGHAVPKQFVGIGGRPLLVHTVEVFLSYDPEIEIVLVLPKNDIRTWVEISKKHGITAKIKVTTGGENRFFSVRNGLDLITGDGIVFIHDGVRPLVSALTINNCYEMAVDRGNAIPVIPVNESLRFVEGESNQAVDRKQFVLVQTPQTFRTKTIQQAYKNAASNNFTDDASVLESMGETINLVPGNRENIKITFPEDLKMVQSLLGTP